MSNTYFEIIEAETTVYIPGYDRLELSVGELVEVVRQARAIVNAEVKLSRRLGELEDRTNNRYG